jgi:hypothetical protein
MARGEEKRRRQELHAEALRRDREANPGPQLPMSEDQLAELVDHLDAWLQDNDCDGTLRETADWSSARGLEPDAVRAGFAELGGGCDCEVVLNMDWRDEAGD